MKTNININANEWCEMVFEGKNHEYGAYAIRTEAATQQAKGLFIAVALAVTIAAIPLISKKISPPVIFTDKNSPVVLHTYEVPPAEIPKVPLPEPPKQAAKPMIKFTTFSVTNNQTQEELPSQDILKTSSAAIGLYTLDGDKTSPIDPDIFLNKTPDREKIPDWVEKMPHFTDLNEYLSKNLRYPSLARDLGISGKVVLKFVVGKQGEISNITVLRSLGGGCDEEAIRVVQAMPRWHPGMQNNQYVAVNFLLTITFQLNNE